jgi:arylsulfatase A
MRDRKPHPSPSLAAWKFSLLVFLVVDPRFVAAATPYPLTLTNASFEEPPVPAQQASTTMVGWVQARHPDHPHQAGGRIVRDDAKNINQAKNGRQWAMLAAGDAIGQALGNFSQVLAQVQDADRFFVSLLLSTEQSDVNTNELHLAIELYVNDSLESWEGGQLIARHELNDLTNDARGDLNSYLDASAVLRLNPETRAAHPATQGWLVLRNIADPQAAAAAVTIDHIGINVAAAPPNTSLPNILIVFQDDLGYGDLNRFNPDSSLPTPSLDRLASQGMTFLDAHAAATICGPSRIGLLTGTMPSKLGVRGNFAPQGNERFGPPTLPTGTPTIATLCRTAGYDTAVVGKWGIPSDWEARLKEGVRKEELTAESAAGLVDFAKPLVNAEAFGFQYRYLFDEHRPFLPGETAPWNGNPRPFGWHENGFAVRDVLARTQDELHEYYLRAITDRAVRYIQTKAGLRAASENQFGVASSAAPFYLHYLTHAPHLPLVPAKQFVGKTSLGAYGDFIFDLDYSLGRLMMALEESQLSANTLLIFSADNGPENSAYARAEQTGHFSMGALRGVKRDLYEGGHRVPLIVSWPERIPAGTIRRSLVSLVDWYATIAAILGVQPPEESGLDSMNLLPILCGDAQEVRGLMLQDSCVNGISRAIRVGPWMYIDQESGELNRRKEPVWFQQLRRVEDAAGNELYNLAEDLGQGRNRMVADRQLAGKLKAIFDEGWGDRARSTPPFREQVDSDGDGYSDFYEQIQQRLR